MGRRFWEGKAQAIVGAVTGLFLGACGEAEPPLTPALVAEATSEDEGEAASELLAATGQAVVSGGGYSCLVLEGGALKCWGDNDVGQLGLGDAAARGDNPGEMGDNLPFVNLGTGKVVKSFAGGFNTPCALLTTNQVKCWGSAGYGHQGNGDSLWRGDEPGEMGDNLPVVDLGTGRTVKVLASGSMHACAILDTNQVKCWGYNGSGLLGLGDTVYRGDNPGEMGDNLPVVYLGAGRTATQLVIAEVATCALLDDGTVKCWGYGGAGQLGNGNTADIGDSPGEMQALQPLSFGTGLVVKTLFGGMGSHFCALFTNNQIKCWGRNTYGALGLGDVLTRGDGPNEMGDNLPFVNLGTSPTVKSVAIGYEHTCAILDLNEAIPGQITTNQVKCWGRNLEGELGQGDTAARGDGPNEMGNNLPLVPLGAGRSARAITAFYSTTVVLDNGQVKAWGYNHTGELGLGDTSNRGDQPNEVGQLPAISLGARSITSVTVGFAHNCARLPIGDLKCWGSNEDGRLGLGNTSNRGDQPNEMGANLPVVSLGTARTVAAVDAGFTHTCALLNAGGVKCWGNNDFGKLGLGDVAARGDGPNEMGDQLPLVALGTGKAAKAVTVGAEHSCALLTSNEVKCWGKNQFGHLGLGDTLDRGDAAGEMGDALPAIPFGTRVPKLIAAGTNHTCAQFTSNEVACWGHGFGGTIGQGSNLSRGDAPNEMGANLQVVNLGTGITAKSIAVGSDHSCAWLSTNQVKCWGVNDHGQLGLGDLANRGDGPGEMGDNLPSIPLGTGRTAKGVFAGEDKTCVLLDTNQLKCFGEGYFGGLGRGDETDRGDSADELGDFAPTIFLGTGRTVVSMATGSAACALLDTNQVKCWGGNQSGQLGLGDVLRRGGQPNEMGDFLKTLDLGPELPP